MAEVNITISGFIIDKYGRTAWPCTVVGAASLTGLGVGGGPVFPPEGGSGAHPEHPIFYPGVPTHPIYYPNVPAHPIVLPPDKPTDPPTEPPTNPADPQWQWVFNPNTGWIPAFVPGPGDAQPHKK